MKVTAWSVVKMTAVTSAVTAGYIGDVEGARNLVMAYAWGLLLPAGLVAMASEDLQEKWSRDSKHRIGAPWRLVQGYGIGTCIWFGAGWTAAAWMVAAFCFEAAFIQAEKLRAEKAGEVAR